MAAEIRGLDLVAGLTAVRPTPSDQVSMPDDFLGDWFKGDVDALPAEPTASGGSETYTTANDAERPSPSTIEGGQAPSRQMVLHNGREYPVVRVNGTWYVATGTATLNESGAGSPDHLGSYEPAEEDMPASTSPTDPAADPEVSLGLNIRGDSASADRSLEFSLRSGIKDADAILKGVSGIIGQLASTPRNRSDPRESDQWSSDASTSDIKPVPLQQTTYIDDEPSQHLQDGLYAQTIDEDLLASKVASNVLKAGKRASRHEARRKLAARALGVAMLGAAAYAAFKYSEDTVTILGYRPFDPSDVPGLISWVLNL